MKKLTITLGSIAAAVAVFWFGWLMPPDLEQVCGNVVALSQPELTDQSPEAATELCLEGLSKGRLEGQIDYVKRVECAGAAQTVEQLEAC